MEVALCEFRGSVSKGVCAAFTLFAGSGLNPEPPCEKSDYPEVAMLQGSEASVEAVSGHCSWQ